MNSPYAVPSRHWELDDEGQPTHRIIERRRRVAFITPVPKPKMQKGHSKNQTFVFDDANELSTEDQAYDTNSLINEVRGYVERWRALPSHQWQVTPETERLLLHWHQYAFSGVRPFFRQVEAAETAIWLTEVAPRTEAGKKILKHLANG